MQILLITQCSNGLHMFFKKFSFFIGAWFVKSVVLVSGVRQSDSVTHIHVFILFQILFPCNLLQNIEQC